MASFQKVINPTKSKPIPTDEYKSEILFKHATDGYIWIEIIIKVIKRDNQGRALEILEIIEDIHDSKMKNLKIIEQQKFISNISESIPQFLTVFDLKTGNCLYTNYENELIFGYTKKEYLEKSHDIVHPDFRSKTIALGKKMTHETFMDDVYSIDFPLKHKTRGYLWVRLKIVITERDKNNIPRQALETLENIDQNKQAFLQVKEQQNFIAEVASIFPNLILVTNLEDNSIMYSNFANRTYLGYKEDEWKEKGDSIIHPEHHKKYYLTLNKLIQENDRRTINIEVQIKDVNGDYFWIAISTRIFKFNKDGKPIQTMSTFTNINDNKLAFNKIFEQQDFIQKVNSTIPSIIQVNDIQNQKIFYTNFANRIFLGYTKKEWADAGVSVIKKEHYRKFLGEYALLKKDGVVRELNQEVLIKNSNNQWVWVQFKIRPLDFDSNGKPKQLMFIFRDINERKQLDLRVVEYQKELDKQIVRLEEQLAKNIELERFASIASHDLKEPLRTIRNYAQILKITNTDNLDEEGQILLDYIENSTKRMYLLVQDILSFSKIDTVGAIFAKVDLNQPLSIVLEDLADAVNKKNIDIKITNKLPTINADQNQIRQVFQNLISNAIKFSIGDSSEIIISSKKKGDKYLFSVVDEGIGIPKSELKNVFGIFRKLHNKTEFEGQGIGLSICKRIIERHEGEIWVESDLGLGTTFYFTLPAS